MRRCSVGALLYGPVDATQKGVQSTVVVLNLAAGDLVVAQREYLICPSASARSLSAFLCSAFDITTPLSAYWLESKAQRHVKRQTLSALSPNDQRKFADETSRDALLESGRGEDFVDLLADCHLFVPHDGWRCASGMPHLSGQAMR